MVEVIVSIHDHLQLVRQDEDEQCDDHMDQHGMRTGLCKFVLLNLVMRQLDHANPRREVKVASLVYAAHGRLPHHDEPGLQDLLGIHVSVRRLRAVRLCDCQLSVLEKY